jgi:hypothetical protein
VFVRVRPAGSIFLVPGRLERPADTDKFLPSVSLDSPFQLSLPWLQRLVLTQVNVTTDLLEAIVRAAHRLMTLGVAYASGVTTLENLQSTSLRTIDLSSLRSSAAACHMSPLLRPLLVTRSLFSLSRPPSHSYIDDVANLFSYPKLPTTMG